MTTLPRYDELPLIVDTDLRCGWSVFGPDDQLGTLNHLTERRRLQAASLVTTGHTINLTLPLDQPDPPLFGRHGPAHEVFRLNAFSWDDRLTLDPQASTQWDGFRHIRHGAAGFYGGRLDDPEPGGALGIEKWVQHGVVGRGVLLDFARYFAESGREFDPFSSQPFSAQDIATVATAQQVELRPGDILCLRFGWVAAHALAPAPARRAQAARVTSAGLSGGEDVARLLWNESIAAVVADNPSVEAMPGDRHTGFLHHRLLTMLGMPLGELFALDELAEYCAGQSKWDFLFVSNPLNVAGGIGSPGNALALL